MAVCRRRYRGQGQSPMGGAEETEQRARKSRGWGRTFVEAAVANGSQGVQGREQVAGLSAAGCPMVVEMLVPATVLHLGRRDGRNTGIGWGKARKILFSLFSFRSEEHTSEL